MSFRKTAVCFLAAAAIATGAFPQVTPAAGVTPPDDTPKVNVGATIFGDYTYTDSPTTKDADGNVIHPSAFNITRAYINITGNLNHLIAFRITPDVSRETGTGSTLSSASNSFKRDQWSGLAPTIISSIFEPRTDDIALAITRLRLWASL